MARKSINTTIDENLYMKLQVLSLELSAQERKKIHVNDLIEDGMRHILKKYNKLDDQEEKR